MRKKQKYEYLIKNFANECIEKNVNILLDTLV